MKHEKLFSAFFAWLLSLAITMGSIGCMLSGLQLQPDNLTGIALACAVTAAFCCICAHVRRGNVIFLCVLALVGGYLWREGTLLLELESLVYHISLIYDKGYGWGTMSWSGAELANVPIDMGVGLLACLCTAEICLTLNLRYSAWMGVIAGFFPLTACMVVTDSIPDAFPLFFLLTGQLILIVSSTVRRKSQAEGLRLTAMLLIPAVLASMLLFHAVPQDGYEAQMTETRDKLLDWVRSLPFVAETPNGQLIFSLGGDPEEDEINLQSVGPKNRHHYPVMDVVSQSGGSLYLRGQAFDTYDGTSWTASENNPFDSMGWPEDMVLTSIGEVTVTTRSALGLRYMPYYLSSDWQEGISQGKLTNPDGQTEYSFTRMYFAPNYYGVQSRPGLSAAAISHYLQLPAATSGAARKLLPEAIFESFYYPLVSQKAESIRTLVSASARYSLNADKMPRDAEDFALWFMQEGDAGYCVHFATAATVLLRAAGIPARYVTGYAVQVTADTPTTVTADRAHAWVEYYDSDRGCWIVLDPTPAGGISTNPGVSDEVDLQPVRPTRPTPQPTESTQETEPPTEATQPTEETEPVTQPTEETDPVTQPTEETDPVTQPTEPPVIDPNDPATREISPVWGWIAGILAAAALVFGQYRLRRQLRRKRLYGGAHNAQALARWQEALRYGRILKVTPPEALEALAEKAKFSQHTLSDEELGEFDAWLRQAASALHKKPLPLRLLWMLVLAVE